MIWILSHRLVAEVALSRLTTLAHQHQATLLRTLPPTVHLALVDKVHKLEEVTLVLVLTSAIPLLIVQATPTLNLTLEAILENQILIVVRIIKTSLTPRNREMEAK